MTETRGITVKIDAELHSRVKAEVEAQGLTMSQYIESVLTEHFNHTEGEENMMGATRTLAFQVSEELFQRVKDYLRKTGITQKQFVIGLIEDELERFEMDERAQTEDDESEDEDEDEDLGEGSDESEQEDGEYAAESPQNGAWDGGPDSDEAPDENAAEGPLCAGVDEGENEDENLDAGAEDEEALDNESDDEDEYEYEDEDEDMDEGPMM